MRIYISHSTDRSYDFREFLYAPLKQSELAKEHAFIFPHERDYGDDPRNMKPEIERASFVVAEASYPSTSSGIELAWAHEAGLPIFVLYQHGRDYSRSLLVLTRYIEYYSGADDMITKIQKFIDDNSHLR